MFWHIRVYIAGLPDDIEQRKPPKVHNRTTSKSSTQVQSEHLKVISDSYARLLQQALDRIYGLTSSKRKRELPQVLSCSFQFNFDTSLEWNWEAWKNWNSVAVTIELPDNLPVEREWLSREIEQLFPIQCHIESESEAIATEIERPLL
jgi:hypothetical protein